MLPHEGAVRAWLRRSRFQAIDPDDLIQEAYARLAATEAPERIENGRAYFFTTVRNLALEQIRRSQIVRIDSIAEIDRLNIEANEPSPESAVASRMEMARVQELIEDLPHRCRQVFVLRKVHSVSQSEIARMLGISESTVEKQASKGLRIILDRLAASDDGGRMFSRRRRSHERLTPKEGKRRPDRA